MNEVAALKSELQYGFTPAIAARLFLAEPTIALDADTRRSFEAQFEGAASFGLDSPYGVAHPSAKFEFMRYLSESQQVLWHGSNCADLRELTPRDQYDFNDNPVRAVFATGDAIWSMFFAIVQRASLQGSMRNACLVVRGKPDRRYYFFSLNSDWLTKNPWTTGTAYALPRDTFRPTDASAVRFDEYVSESAVKPHFKLTVTPADFPFLAQVAGHDEHESIYESWLHYKKRIAQ